jgi:predicted alpha/beta-fold hydrolase
LSVDIRRVIAELIERDNLPEIFAAGFSMGGNLVLKMAGEFGESPPAELRAIFVVAPALDLAACASALDEPRNFIYQRHFVRKLKARMRRKAALFPDRYPRHQLEGLGGIRTVREFDDVITARYCGFESASDYYRQSSAKNVVAAIRFPAAVLASEDDPFVPITSVDIPAVRGNESIFYHTTRYGGHCGFISRVPGQGRFWAESQIVEFCRRHSRLGSREPAGDLAGRRA